MLELVYRRVWGTGNDLKVECNSLALDLLPHSRHRAWRSFPVIYSTRAFCLHMVIMDVRPGFMTDWKKTDTGLLLSSSL
jgi:hypothetical protein